MSNSLQEHINHDPTKEEMMEYLRRLFGNEEGFEYDAEAAIYWFGADYHSGQFSNLYSASSSSQYRPSRMANGPESGSMEEIMYRELEAQYGNPQPNQIRSNIDAMGDSPASSVREGFDPWSNGGPNPVADNKDGNGSNPYKDWNRQMSQMEEEANPEPHDDETGVSQPSPRDRIEPSNSSQVFNAKYKSSIVIKQEPHGIMVIAYNPIGEIAGGGLLSFSYGPEDYSKAVQMSNHLKAKYKAYKVVDLVNPSSTSKNLTEQGDSSEITDTLKKEIYIPLIDAGFQYHNYGDGKIDYVEYYLNGYATIQCAVNYEKNYIHVEKYYDNERFDHKNFLRKIPIQSENQDEFANKIVSICILLKNGAKGDESIEGGTHDELDEHTPEVSTEPIPKKERCRACGNAFIPSYGEYNRCPDCLSKQHDAGEKTTGTQ